MALGLGLALVELAAILVELRSAIIQDWFISLAPLIWLNASVLFIYALMRLLGGVGGTGEKRETKRGTVLTADFEALRRVIRPRSFRLVWVLSAAAYAIIYMVLQGSLVVAPNGNFETGVLLLSSPLGYGPALRWSPVSSLGLLLRPYTLAAAVALSLFSGLVIALFVTLLTRGRRNLVGLSGPLSGLGVICPTCIATPAAGLFLAWLAPAATLVGLTTLPVFTMVLAISTALLLAGLLLLWMTMAWLSRMMKKDSPSGASGSQMVVDSEDGHPDQGYHEHGLDEAQGPDEA